jgi:ABC-type Na+ efflux pump permease subunit
VGHGWDHIWILVAWSLWASVSAVILSLCAISYILVINKTFCQARQRVNTVLFIIAFILLLIPLSADYVDPVVYLGLIFIALVISLFFRIKVFVALELPEGRRNWWNRNRKE